MDENAKSFWLSSVSHITESTAAGRLGEREKRLNKIPPMPFPILAAPMQTRLKVTQIYIRCMFHTFQFKVALKVTWLIIILITLNISLFTKMMQYVVRCTQYAGFSQAGNGISVMSPG